MACIDSQVSSAGGAVAARRVPRGHREGQRRAATTAKSSNGSYLNSIPSHGAPQAVRSQLARFREGMEKDSAAQRRQAGDLILEAVRRCEKFVDRTLMLSNIGGLSSYLLGAGSAGALPVVRYVLHPTYTYDGCDGSFCACAVRTAL